MTLAFWPLPGRAIEQLLAMGQMHKDGVDHLLATRPTADDLVAAGILHAPPGVSASSRS